MDGGVYFVFWKIYCIHWQFFFFAGEVASELNNPCLTYPVTGIVIIFWSFVFWNSFLFYAIPCYWQLFANTNRASLATSVLVTGASTIFLGFPLCEGFLWYIRLLISVQRSCWHLTFEVWFLSILVLLRVISFVLINIVVCMIYKWSYRTKIIIFRIYYWFSFFHRQLRVQRYLALQ